jgi:hypothetical protein
LGNPEEGIWAFEDFKEGFFRGVEGIGRRKAET